MAASSSNAIGAARIAPNALPSTAMEEVRLARDGSPYTWEQFFQWYGREANTYWDDAAAVSLEGAAEHGENPASEALLQNTAEIEAGATEHDENFIPPRHPANIILSLHDLRSLAREEISTETRRDLHREARNLLNQIANGNYNDQNILDLTEIWPRWNAWLATQAVATQSFESDVAAITAEAIENTTDPNRGGRPRVDFCVRLVDGSYWRFHPGSKERNSAKPLHISATLPDATRGAAEHAAIQWTTLGQGNAWTITQSTLVPQTDRMGKDAVWQQISALLEQDAIPREDEFIDITNGAIIPWWLWASNLGHRTRDVIGEGIKEIHLSRILEHEVVFNFIRADNTTASLLFGIR